MKVSLVAEVGGRIIGHLLLTAVSVDGARVKAAGLGPVAVIPESQRKGTGSALVRASLEKCSLLGIAAVFVLGHPSYYPRFGFVPASRFNLRFADGVPENAFMVRELVSGSLAGTGGYVRYLPEFDGV